MAKEISKSKTTWRKVKLGEVVEIIDGDRGLNYPGNGEFFSNGHCLFLNAKNVCGTDFNFSNTQFITKKKDNSLRSGKTQRGDFVLTTRGTVGNIAYYGDGIPYDNVRINSGMVILRPKKDIIDEKFFYLFLISKEFKNQIEALKSGSAQPQLPIRDLKFFEIGIPLLGEQEKIVKILYPIEDKIKLNNKINQNLEQMAQAIFREWFVKGSKLKVKSEKLKRWEIKKIGDTASVILGGTPSRINKEFWGGKIPWINSGKVNEFRIISASEYITEKGLRKSNTQIMPKRTTVIAITGATLGQVSLLEIEACANQSVVGIFGSDLLSPEFIYLFIKNKINEIIQRAGGGAQQHINKGIVENYPILLPQQNIILKFNKTIKPIFDQISNNVFENQKLASLRDLLLPKLMSGEIRA